MADVEIGDHRYRIGKMSVFDQAHVARKIAPVVFTLGRGYAQAMSQFPAAMAQQSADTGNGVDEHPDETPPDPDPQETVQQNEILFNALSPIADVLARMEEHDVDYVLKKCLSIVSRFNGERYVPMMRSGNLMFEDLDLATLMQLTMEVVQDNLGPTLLALAPLGLGGGGTTSQSNTLQ